MRVLSSIVLASASPRRHELLRSLGLAVEVAATEYEEPAIATLAPAELASAHAREKLRRAVARKRPENGVPVLAADTVVDLDGDALGKPRSAAEAIAMLERLSGREHDVHTAFALASSGAEWIAERSTTRVRFYALEAGEIGAYVATGEPYDKAGGYGIQGRAAGMIEGIDGDFYTVMGLPLARLIRSLRRLGFVLPSPNER